MVKKNRISTIHNSGVLLGPALAYGRKSRKATPITMVPRANLIGVDGCRGPSRVHIVANTPAKTMMKMGLIDCTQLGGMVQPPTVRSRRCSA